MDGATGRRVVVDSVHTRSGVPGPLRRPASPDAQRHVGVGGVCCAKSHGRPVGVGVAPRAGVGGFGRRAPFAPRQQPLAQRRSYGARPGRRPVAHDVRRPWHRHPGARSGARTGVAPRPDGVALLQRVRSAKPRGAHRVCATGRQRHRRGSNRVAPDAVTLAPPAAAAGHHQHRCYCARRRSQWCR